MTVSKALEPAMALDQLCINTIRTLSKELPGKFGFTVDAVVSSARQALAGTA